MHRFDLSGRAGNNHLMPNRQRENLTLCPLPMQHLHTVPVAFCSVHPIENLLVVD
jgi:hypothetical protein